MPQNVLIITEVGHALWIALAMFWQILWPLILRRFLSQSLLSEAKANAEQDIRGKMEGHAAMHMELTEGSIWSRLTSEKGRTYISHYE